MKSGTYTVGRIAELFRVSRSTLLYYDSIRLFSPSGRSAAGYRLYTEKDRERLERIMAFRDAGVPLERIREYLESPQDGPVALLLERIFEINARIQDLRTQQAMLLDFLEADGTLKGKKDVLHTLEELGRKAGITSADSRFLHRRFEANSPEAHARLLRFLGFSDAQLREFLRHIENSG